MLNLDKAGQASWFREMIAAVNEAEQETGVKLRFLIGLPRNYGPAKVMDELDKIKYAARHPLIAGVDLLGYEFNRTSDFTATLGHIAEWAKETEGTELDKADGWDFKRDFTIRIHAGETGKNSGNVAEAVKIAEDYGIRVRIAHAVNGRADDTLDKDIERLSKQKPPLVSMEFCPPSNIAYNNIQDLRDVPYQRWLKYCKSWFLGSDGAGAIQTTPTQLALSAVATGKVNLAQLEQMRRTEEAFITEEASRFAEKTAAYHKLYGEGDEADEKFLEKFAEHVREVNEYAQPAVPTPKHPPVPIKLNPKEFGGKIPILVAGASGDSMEGVATHARGDIKRAMHMLVGSVDPKKVYFVVGRSKSEGVTAALDEAIVEYNSEHPGNKFKVLALTTLGTRDMARSITKVVEQDGGLDQVPDNLISFMRAQLAPGKMPGLSVFIGGSNFTSDMIRKCRDNGLDYFLMENVPGASQQFARKAKPEQHFNNGKNLLNRIDHLLKGEKTGPLRQIFCEGFQANDNEAVTALEKAARGRYPDNAMGRKMV
jgi:adenosine deaminase